MVSALPAKKSGGKFFGYRRNLAARYRTGHALAETSGVASRNDPDNCGSLIVRQRHSHVKNRLATSHPEQAATRAADVVEFRDGEARRQALTRLSLRTDRRKLSRSHDAGNELLQQLGGCNVIAPLLANRLRPVDDYPEGAVLG